MQKVNRVIKYDIAVIGSGVSGLTAAVQAVELGKKVVLLESSRRIGGNWNVTYGMMAVDSPLSRAQGIYVDAQALVNQEVRLFNYQVDSKLWMDVAKASGENVSWLMKQGVEFNEKLEPYTAGDIYAPVFHAWKVGSGPSQKMLAAFEKLGGTAMIETKAVELIMEDGKVKGVLAEKKDGSVIQIDCKAVICAGGGYAKNPEMVSRCIGRTDYACRAIAENDGSTILMCTAVGAKSLYERGNQIVDLIPREMKSVNHWLTYIHSRPGSYPFHVTVNQDAERYVDESCTLHLYGFSPAAAYTQERTYTIYDEEKLKKLEELNDNGVFEKLKSDADKGEAGVFRAGTFEELAEKLGLDPKRFAETMERYNGYCDTGEDEEYEKNPEFLQGFYRPPFYGWENGYQIASTLEGIDYNRKMEVISMKNEPIPGLYVAGTDGAKLWRDYYSLGIPGACNSNNVYTGRKAAQSAVAYMNQKGED